MPQARGDKEAQLPILGLNTEASPLTFPENAFVYGNNVELAFDPLRVQRRRGIDNTRGNFSSTRITTGENLLATAYLWEGVAGVPDVNIYVVQLGSKLVFHNADVDNPTTAPYPVAYPLRLSRPLYDASDVKGQNALGANAGEFITPLLPENFRCEFANVKGALIVCNPAINPVLIQFNTDPNIADADRFTFQDLNIRIRDFLGIADELKVDARPDTLSEQHEYNLYNQGWHQRRPTFTSVDGEDAVTEFFNIVGAYPSNADVSYIGMVPYENTNDPADARTGQLYFNPEIVRDISFGGSPTPRGHYIVDAFNINRNEILNNPSSFEFTGRVLADPDVVPPPTEDTAATGTESGTESTGTTGGSGGGDADAGGYGDSQKPFIEDSNPRDGVSYDIP